MIYVTQEGLELTSPKSCVSVLFLLSDLVTRLLQTSVVQWQHQTRSILLQVAYEMSVS